VPWLVLIVSAILWRRATGLPLLTGRPADATFYSAAASGSSNGNMFVALLPTRNALAVSVTPDELRIGVIFPLNLTFLGQIADVEHRVPRRSVRASLATGFLGEVALAEFTGADGLPRTMRLKFNRPENFVRAIEGRDP
jgi:hypothetical protein